MIDVDKTTFEEEVLKAEGLCICWLLWRWMCSLSGTDAEGTWICRYLWGQAQIHIVKYNKSTPLGNCPESSWTPVMAIYKDGEKVEELVKDDCTAEAIEAMIKKYIWFSRGNF